MKAQINTVKIPSFELCRLYKEQYSRSESNSLFANYGRVYLYRPTPFLLAIEEPRHFHNLRRNALATFHLRLFDLRPA